MPKKSASTTRAPARKRVSKSATKGTRRYAVKGRGGYWDNVKSRWGQGGGSMKDTFRQAGHLLGGPLGEQAGGLVNRGLYALTGFGDYDIRSNSLLETNGPPSVINRGNKEFVVRHREYIQDIYSSGGSAGTPSPFGILSYPLNPGSVITFPWLSSIADKFEQYRIEGMVFEYKSLYSDAVVTQNGSIGSVILATEYNSGAPQFSSKQAMENYQFAQSAKPSHSILHPIECARGQNVLSELYVRPGTVPPGEDVKTYDFGDFQIASQGIPLGTGGAAVPLGELWCSYQIALLKPRIATATGGYTDSGFAYFSGLDNNAGFVPWGTIPCAYNRVIRRPTSNLPIVLSSDNTFTINCGSVPMTYLFELTWQASSTSSTATWRGPGTVLNNCTYVNPSTAGSYQIYTVPSQSQIANGCSTSFFLNVPAALPGKLYSTVVVQSSPNQFDQTLPVRFEMWVNAVPTPLVP